MCSVRAAAPWTNIDNPHIHLFERVHYVTTIHNLLLQRLEHAALLRYTFAGIFNRGSKQRGSLSWSGSEDGGGRGYGACWRRRGQLEVVALPWP